MNRLSTAVAGLSLSMATVSAFAQNNFAKPEDGSCRSVSIAACTVAAAIGRGINFGEILDAPKEGDWGQRLEPEYIDKATAVFKTVRLPVRFSNHAALTEDATLEPAFVARVDGLIDTLLAKGVYVILDLHNYNQLAGMPLNEGEAAVDPAVVDNRFLNIWAQLAERYKDKSPKLIFELYNEPTGRLDNIKWNALAPQALAVVRKSNPERIVVIGGGNYNAAKALPGLVLPTDQNLIVPVHDYTPFDFTHQGIRWMPWLANKHSTCCNAVQHKAITDSLDLAKKWSVANGYPVFIGEFGSYSAGDMASRAAWTRLFRDEVEKRGFSWTYWNFAGAFGIYDKAAHAWFEPLRAALLD